MPERTGRVSGECLDPEVLSAYIDGQLDVSARAEVEAHLASCADCYDVMSEVLHIQEALPAARPESSSTPRAWGSESDAARDMVSAPVPRPGGDHIVRGAFGRRKAVWGAAGVVLAAAAALVLVVRLQPTWWTGGVDPKLADLVAAVGEERTVEARLTGGFKYGPLRSPVRSGGRVGPTDNWRLLAAAGRIREEAEKDPSAENLHALGVAHLLLGEYDDAVQSLERAAGDNSEPRVLNDLAAALLARSTSLDRPEDLPRALDVVERAHAARRLPEIEFTRALILSRMGLADRAHGAWQDYLDSDLGSAWAIEAKQHLHSLQERPPQSRLDELKRQLESREGRLSAATALDAQFPDQISDIVLARLVPAWAAAVAADETAEAADLIRVLGSMWRSWPVAEGDAPHGKLTSAALRGIEALGRGTSLLADDRYVDAELPLQAASRILDGEIPPLARWSRYGLARVSLFRGDLVAARAFLQSVLDAGSDHDEILRAYALWIRGLVSFSEGRWSAARTDYERAYEAFLRVRNAQAAATVSVNLSILYRFLGDRSEVWRHRMKALSLMPRHAPALAHGYLVSTAITASLEGNHHAALMFADSAVDNATHLPPQLQAVAHLQRARLLARVGRSIGVARDLAFARAARHQIGDQAISEQVQLALLTAEAEVGSTDSASTVRVARDAIALAARRRDLLRSAELHLYLGRSLAASGDRAGATAALEAGIEHFEAGLATLSVGDPVHLSAFEPVWELFDELVKAHLDETAPDRERAFSSIERSRARSLFEFKHLQPIGLADAMDRLSAHEAVLIVHQLQQDVVLWLLRRGDSRIIRSPLSLEQATRLVADVGPSAWNGRSQAAAARIFDAILKPVAHLVPHGSTLAIVAGEPFSSIPWSGLPTSATQELVLDRWPVIVSPSVAVALQRASSRRPGTDRALILVNSRATDAATLPAVKTEGASIAQLYDAAEMRSDRDATPGALLELAPRFPVIHIAAHAVNSASYPMLSRLLLAPAVGESGELSVERIVGELRLGESPVVVIATCSSFGETVRRGEGAIGLSWAFLAVGARQVVSTLWEIEDRASVDFFVDLHRGIRSGVDAHLALRDAQVNARARGIPRAIWSAVQIVGQL